MRVVTWNLENLFTPSSGGPPAPGRPTEAAYAAKLETLTRVVAALAPDVLAVQEVGDEQALDDLRTSLDGATSGGWVSRCSRVPDGRGIRVAVLTTRDVLGTGDLSILPPLLRPVQVDDAGTTVDRMGRGALRVRVGAYALFRRAAEAAALRVGVDDVLRGQGRERAFVLCGDMNDTVEAATTQLLQGPTGSEVGTASALTPDQGDAHRLWNVAPRIPAERRFSRVYRGRGELIDHLLVSRALLERIQGADSAVDAAGEAMPSVTDDPRNRVDTPGSDHAPVLVDLDW